MMCFYGLCLVIEFDNETGGYYPVMYLNDYWNYFSDYMPVNETTKYVFISIKKPVHSLHCCFSLMNCLKRSIYY